MSAPQPPARCPHGLNPKACLPCFHAPKPAAAAAPPRPQMAGGMAPAVAPPHIQRAIDRQKGVEQPRAVPAPRGEQAINPKPREPKPAQQQQAVQHAGSVPQPWRAEEKQPWVQGEDGVFKPAQARYTSIIDSLPRHPEAQ